MFATVLCAIAFTISTFAADVAKTTVLDTSLFNAGEVGLSLASGYDFGTADNVVTSVGKPSGGNKSYDYGCNETGGTSGGKASPLFGKPYNFNLNAGAFYFPWRNLGLEANVPFYQTKGVSVNEVQSGLLLRLPLSRSTPVFRNLSPYVGASVVYNWKYEQTWSYIAKTGLEVRLNKKWGVFTEAQYRNYEFKNWGQGAVSINGGLKFVF